MPNYPDTLPTPEQTGGAIDSGILRTSVYASRANQRQSFNSTRTDVTLQFSMTIDKYQEWRTWVKANGYYWNPMPIVSSETPDVIYSVQNVRFTSDCVLQKQGDNWLSVSVQAELIPGDD